MDKKEYSNGEIAIIWQPKNIYPMPQNVLKKLPKVYHPRELPWITPEHANTEELIAQINCCPSGALTFARRLDSADK